MDQTGSARPDGIHRYLDSGFIADFPGPDTETWYAWRCDGPGRTRFAWFPSVSPPRLTAADLLPGVIDRARREAPAPVLNIAPPPTLHGIVNLGMYLAIEPPAPFTVRSEAGNAWARADVALVSTTWDMGNGDVVFCQGPGVPWDGINGDPAQGPCGYTYRAPSAPRFTGNGQSHYTASVRATWSVRVRTSAGRDDVIDPIVRELRYDYPVYEIQTVGVPAG